MIRADGHSGTDILEAVLSLFPLDKVADKNTFLMAVSEKNMQNPPIWREYQKLMENYEQGNVKCLNWNVTNFMIERKMPLLLSKQGERRCMQILF